MLICQNYLHSKGKIMSFKHLSKEFQLSGKILIKIILKRFFRSFKTGILLLFLHPVWFSRRLIAKMRLLKGVPDKKLIKNMPIKKG